MIFNRQGAVMAISSSLSVKRGDFCVLSGAPHTSVPCWGATSEPDFLQEAPQNTHAQHMGEHAMTVVV